MGYLVASVVASVAVVSGTKAVAQGVNKLKKKDKEKNKNK